MAFYSISCDCVNQKGKQFNRSTEFRLIFLTPFRFLAIFYCVSPVTALLRDHCGNKYGSGSLTFHVMVLEA